MRKILKSMAHLLALNIVTGVAVAGIDAGKVFNTFPLMGSKMVPGDVWRKNLGVRNLFQNCSCAQFLHRGLAFV